VGIVFADSGYWIALWNPRDALHQRAMAVAHALRTSDVVTTQLVLVETLNSMAGSPEYRRTFAAGMVHELELEADPSVEIVPQTDAQFRAAVERYAA
jgi:predicted nucleic acid-binding protein